MIIESKHNLVYAMWCNMVWAWALWDRLSIKGKTKNIKQSKYIMKSQNINRILGCKYIPFTNFVIISASFNKDLAQQELELTMVLCKIEAQTLETWLYHEQ